MDLLLVSIAGSGAADRPPPAEGLLRDAGARTVDAVAAGPDGASVDAVLDRRDGRRLVIAADRSGLALVLTRLMRRGELAEADTAVLPAEPIGYLTAAGLPADLPRRAAAAVHAPTRLVGVVKDDSGGLCVDGATLVRWPDGAGGDWWMRAVVDDQRLCDGPVRGLTLQRLGPASLRATVRTGRLRRTSCTGRSLQLACDPALITSDGVPRERPRSKRTFWSEPTLWKLALG